MLVSTLDGKVSALNLEKDGELEWTINTGGRHMLSSSISKLEVFLLVYMDPIHMIHFRQKYMCILH